MQTPKVGGRYKRLADGTVVPAETAPKTEPQTTVPAPALADATAAADSNPEEGE